MKTMRLTMLLSTVLALLCLIAPGGAQGQGTAAPIYMVRIAGAISPATAGFLESSLDTAVEQGAQALLIELDTPGGLAQAMRDMVKTIMNAPLPVLVYVSPTGAQAASAGVMITMAADVAAMAPGTNIGAAHPVAIGGQDVDGEMKKKVVNDMVAFIQGIAKERDRNVGWAKKAVEQSVSITADEAEAIDVIDLVAESRADLLEKVDGWTVERGRLSAVLNTDVEVVLIEPTWRDRILKTLADPNIAYLLIMLGLAGLYFELTNPGSILPGVVGATSLILAFYSFQALPVNYAGLLLILAGLILFVLEIKVTSFGMLTVGGLACLTLGSVMLFKKTPEEFVRVSYEVMIPVLAAVGLFFVVVTTLVVRAHRTKPAGGFQGLVGRRGTVKHWSDGRGKVFVHGEWWSADGEDGLNAGDAVVVTGADGLRLKVKKSEART
jgi:membrane-bound serine protease (ClpP class)